MIAVIKHYEARKGMTFDFIHGKDIVAVDRLLNQTQINYLKKYGNTVINEQVLAKLGKDAIIKEIKELTGLDVTIETYESLYDGTSVIIQAIGEFPVNFVPTLTINRTKFKKYYVIYQDGKELMKFNKELITLNEVKDLLKMNGVVDYEVR